MSDAKTEKVVRKKPNRVVLNVPPHIRLAVDEAFQENLEHGENADFDYVSDLYVFLIRTGLEAAYPLTEETIRKNWKDHCRKMINNARESDYFWRGMRNNWM